MATAIRRAAPAPTPQPATDGVNFGDLGFYSGGFTLPEGDYTLTFKVQNFDGFGTGKKGPMRLGVMLDAQASDGEVKQVFYSMGSKADQSYAPNPSTGKGLVPIPGGPGGGLNNSTNWMVFLKSLYDAGLPQGVFTNDLGVLDGVKVHMVQIPEPEDRKGFQSATGEAGQEPRQNQKIAVVSEILDGGKPWETGQAQTKPAAAAKPTAAPAPVQEASADDDVLTAALAGLEVVLTKSPNGCTKLLARTGTFAAVSGAYSAEMATAVIDTYFSSDDALNTALGQLGYKVAGPKVVLL